MFKKARFVLNLLQNYKKIGENLQLFREILYFCIKISNIFAFRLLYNQKRALSGVFFLMVYDGSGKRKMEKKIIGEQNMKRKYLLAVLIAAAMPLTSMAQDDDLYFNPKKEPKKRLKDGLCSSASMLNSGHVEIVFIGCFGAEATVR